MTSVATASYEPENYGQVAETLKAPLKRAAKTFKQPSNNVVEKINEDLTVKFSNKFDEIVIGLELL